VIGPLNHSNRSNAENKKGGWPPRRVTAALVREKKGRKNKTQLTIRSNTGTEKKATKRRSGCFPTSTARDERANSRQKKKKKWPVGKTTARKMLGTLHKASNQGGWVGGEGNKKEKTNKSTASNIIKKVETGAEGRETPYQKRTWWVKKTFRKTMKYVKKKRGKEQKIAERGQKKRATRGGLTLQNVKHRRGPGKEPGEPKEEKKTEEKKKRGPLRVGRGMNNMPAQQNG